MKTLCCTLVLLTMIISSRKPQQPLSFVYSCEDGLCIEVVNLDSTAIDNYTDDNKIYREGLTFVYDYHYIDDGTYLIGNEGHRLDTITEKNSQTIV